MNYSNSLTVEQARALYFQNSGFDEATYTDKWVKLPILNFFIYLPNLEPRRIAAPLHDIDHVLTEYPTDWFGEWQISSYEIGTGCGRYWMGWIINLQAILAGGIREPLACVNAFARGRKSKGVYHFASHHELLQRNLGELRKETTSEPIKAGLSDFFLFYLIYLVSLVIHLVPIGFLILAGLKTIS